MNPIVLAACDVPYFMQHGVAFAKSLKASKNRGLILLFANMDYDLIDQWVQLWNIVESLDLPDSIQIQAIEPRLFNSFYADLDVHNEKAFYASVRFLLLPYLISTGNSYIILDIDSIVNKQIVIPDEYDYGLFLREDNTAGGSAYEQTGMKVAAGSVYITPRAQEFAVKVTQILRASPIQWFCDQVALYGAYKQVKDTLKLCPFDGDFLDWEFKPGTVVWTGKGPRKFENQTYLTAKQQAENF
jgi:hypothetical protein